MLRKPSSLNIDDLAFEHAIRALVPSGDTPFAVRLNSATGVLYVSCTSGKVLQLTVEAIKAKAYGNTKPQEGKGLVIPVDPAKDKPPFEARQLPAELPPGYYRYRVEYVSKSAKGSSNDSGAESSEGNASGNDSAPSSPEDEAWAIAEARFNEFWSSYDLQEPIECHVNGCRRLATVSISYAFTVTHGGFSLARPTWGNHAYVCKACAKDLVHKGGLRALDWKDEE